MLNFMRRWRERQQAQIAASVREAVRSESDRQQGTIAVLQQQTTTLQQALTTAQAERDQLRAKVREQTEADLVLVSLRIVMKATQGDKAGATALERQQAALRHQLAQMQNVYAPPSPYLAGGLGNFFGTLGIH